MTDKKLENFVADLKKVKELDKAIEILKSEIEDNLFDKNESTLINFTLVKKETVEVKDVASDLITKYFMENDDMSNTSVNVTNVKYTEDFEVSEEFATKIQVLLLKDLKKQRKDVIKKIEANENSCKV
jgi:hypothetical protein